MVSVVVEFCPELVEVQGVVAFGEHGGSQLEDSQGLLVILFDNVANAQTDIIRWFLFDSDGFVEAGYVVVCVEEPVVPLVFELEKYQFRSPLFLLDQLPLCHRCIVVVNVSRLELSIDFDRDLFQNGRYFSVSARQQLVNSYQTQVQHF